MEIKEKTRDYCEIERDLIKAIKSIRRNFDESFLIFSRVYNELMNTKKDDVIKADLYSVNRFSHKITHDVTENCSSNQMQQLFNVAWAF